MKEKQMEIYIKSMEMPKNCYDCTMESICNRWALHDVEWQKENRDKDCPLVPVPPHGELIDRAELWVKINKICDRRDAGIITDLTCLQQILSALRHAPAIIPAEEDT